jgi:hypothetical protein
MRMRVRRGELAYVGCSSLPVVPVDERMGGRRLRGPCMPALILSSTFVMAAGNEMSNTLDRLGGSLINAVLGGLILWVGQTAVRHEGVLAGVDEKMASINQQFTDVEKRHESLRKWLENVVNDMKDNNRAQFTLKDGDKLVAQVRQSEQVTAELERRFVERLSQLEIKLAALDTHHRGSHDVAALQLQVAQLRGELASVSAAAQQVYVPPNQRIAHEAPVYLPPVDTRR